MTVLRARSACPKCSEEEEVWYYKGKVVPTESIECQRCSYLYTSSNFIVSVLELYQNVTISTISHKATLTY
jgi:Zn ribbon nucleic-acid-binding protein